MDTIVYLYRGRDREIFQIEKTVMDYCLIRVGLPLMLWKEKHPDMWQELYYLGTAVRFLGENPHWTYSAYEDFLDFLRETDDWKRNWTTPLFEDYRDYFWADKVAEQGKLDYWILLGYEDCIPTLLQKYAKRMRGIRWYLAEEGFTEPLQEWADEFYREYGLAIEFKVNPDGRRLHPSASQPVNVLDFSGDDKISACDIPRGSIWLDVCAEGHKRRTLEARNPQITYFSLKKQWEQSQKAPIILDTPHKNGYNRNVNQT